MTRKPISIILADDQAEVRAALRRYLDHDGRFTIVAEAKDGAETLGRVRLLKPEALILDLAMPDPDGLQVLPMVKDVSPGTQVFVLSSMAPFNGVGDQALALGATAVFDKYVSPKVIIATIIASRLELGDDDLPGGGLQADHLKDLDLPTTS